MQIKHIFTEIFNIRVSGARKSLPVDGRSTANTTGTNGSPENIEEDLQLLYAYIEAELDREDAAILFPKVHAALQISEDARVQYEDLKEILASERAGTLVVPDRVPDFDFSYLHKGPLAEDLRREVAEKSWCWDQALGQLVVKFSEDLIESIQQALLMPPRLQAALRSSGTITEIFRFDIDQKDKDLCISFVATGVENDESLCNITVTVDRPSVDGAPLMADSRVFLTPSYPSRDYPPQDEQSSAAPAILDPKGDQPEMPRRELEDETIVQSTTPFGKTVFHQIPVLALPHLQFSIEPAPLLP